MTFGYTLESEDLLERYPILLKLPHGSGIDADWGLSIDKDGWINASNSFHAMDEDGYYCGWLEFTLIFQMRDWGWNNFYPKIILGDNSIDCYTTDEDGSIISDTKFKTETIYDFICDILFDWLESNIKDINLW